MKYCVIEVPNYLHFKSLVKTFHLGINQEGRGIELLTLGHYTLNFKIPKDSLIICHLDRLWYISPLRNNPTKSYHYSYAELPSFEDFLRNQKLKAFS